LGFIRVRGKACSNMVNHIKNPAKDFC
jgi:hypothetical protein